MSEPDEETLRERLAYLGYATIERTAKILPESLGRPMFEALAVAAVPLARRARAVVAGNLSRVIGRPADSPIVRAATREAFRSYARYWYDTFHVLTLSEEEFLRRQRFLGSEHLRAAADAGTGSIVALPHLGNWDTAGHWVAVQGYAIAAVAELLRPERLFRLFFDHREGLGMKVLPLTEDRKSGEELVRLLGQNHVIALVADRDLKNSGVVVEMFGAERRMPAGPALLSLVSGAPLLPCACYDTADGWVAQIEAPLEIERTDNLRDDVTRLTRMLAKRFERGIEAAPTQWHMFQPAWEGEERVRAPATSAAAAST